MDPSLITGLVVWYVVFLFATTLHEAAHAFVSARGGDYTAYHGGQVTLNPLPHIKRERLGMVIVPIISFILNKGEFMFGWASAPFNPYWAARYPRRAFLMSLAGPLSHLPLALLSWLAMFAGLRLGYFTLPLRGNLSASHLVASHSPTGLFAALAMLLSVMFTLNLVLLIFNLLPLPPMDGSELWYQFIDREEERLRWRGTFGSYSLAGLLLAWYVFPRIFEPVFGKLVVALYTWT